MRPDDPQNINSLPTIKALGYSPELDGKIPLLKTPQTISVRHGETKGEALSPVLVFAVLEDALGTTRGEK